jgi:nucleotide-binding universal stress UspA family protein
MPIEPMPPVVVGVDGSAESLAALDLAADEALARVTCLTVVHAFEPQPLSPAFARELTQVRQMVSAAEDRARAEHPGLAVSSVVTPGDPAEVLLERAARASLALLGYRGHGGRHEAETGRVAARVAVRAIQPVIVCRPFDRPHTGSDPRPVLVGVDGLVGCEAAVAFAFEEAALRGAPLHAAYVCGPGERTAWRVLADALAVWSAKYPQVQVIRHIRRSADPVNELIDASHGAQLAIVGRHDRYGLPRRMLGAVAGQLLDRAGCSVAVVGHR